MTRTGRTAGTSAAWEPIVLLALAFILAVIRFHDLGSAPFINDEPKLQIIIDDHLQNHTLPMVGLVGTREVQYGPTALWAYLPVRFFTDNIDTIVAAHAAYVVLGLLLLFLAIRRTIGKTEAAWIFTLAASSPFLFFYARLAWDNTFLIPTTGGALYALSLLDGQRERRPWIWLALGILAGLAFNAHLMIIPVLAALGIATFPHWLGLRSWKRMMTSASALVIGFAAVTVGYIASVYPSLLQGSQMKLSWQGFLTIPSILAGTTQWVSQSGMVYFLDQPATTILDAGWILRGAALIMAGICALRFRQQPTLVRFGVWSILLLALYYVLLLPDLRHPHYFMGVWWVPFLFLAPVLQRRSAAIRTLAKGTIALVIAMNVAFVGRTYAGIRENSGTRGLHYGTSQAQIHATVQAMCLRLSERDASRAVVDLTAVPGVLPPSVIYFFLHLPACAGREIAFAQSAVDQGTIFFRLRYGSATPLDAGLKLE